MLIKCCTTCKWYEDYAGALLQRRIRARADFTDAEDGCEDWEGDTP